MMEEGDSHGIPQSPVVSPVRLTFLMNEETDEPEELEEERFRLEDYAFVNEDGSMLPPMSSRRVVQPFLNGSVQTSPE